MLYFFYFTTPPIVTFNLSEEIKILVVTFSFPALPLAGPPLVPNCTPSSLLQAYFLDTLPLSGSTLTPQKPSPLTGAPLVPTCTPPWQVHPLSPISCSLNIYPMRHEPISTLELPIIPISSTPSFIASLLLDWIM